MKEEDLVDNFGDLGNCLSVKILRDRYSGISRGFAFVETATAQKAKDATLKWRGVENGTIVPENIVIGLDA